MPSSWIEYWNGSPTIYTCARHRDAHDFDIAFSIVTMLHDAQAVVFDFGCGEASRAHFVANRCKKLYLLDGAKSVRTRLVARHSSCPNIEVLGEDWHKHLPPASIDLLTLNSVVQYLSPVRLGELLAQFRCVLKPTGRMVVSDVIPPNLRPIGDAFELLKFARAEGFLSEALAGLFRTAFSNYTRMRRHARLSKYSEAGFVEIVNAAGFEAIRQNHNVGHNRRRMTFVAKIRASDALSNPIPDAAE